MNTVREHERSGIEQGSTAADWAISVIRRSLHGTRGCAATPRSLPTFLADLEAIGALFRAAHETMIGVQGAGLNVGLPGTAATTRHEHSLIRAASAVQAENASLADHYLFQLAPHPRAHAPLVHAVTALATSLAAFGHWFCPLPLPAPALQVARLHGIDLRTVSVAWAHPGGGRHVPL